MKHKYQPPQKTSSGRTIITIPKFTCKEEIDVFFRFYYSVNRSVNFFYYLKCRAFLIKDLELRKYFIDCALRFCEYASSGKSDFTDPKMKEAYEERMKRVVVRKMIEDRKKKRIKRELTDEDRERRAQYERQQEDFKQAVKEKKHHRKVHVRLIHIPFGGMNKKY